MYLNAGDALRQNNQYMATPVLIYCHGGNERAAGVARSLGWELGTRSDYTVYPIARPLWLLDMKWRDYDWPRHLAQAQLERPFLAAVPDVEAVEQLPGALFQAEELAPWCSRILLIPKCDGIIEQLPHEINGRPVVLGYSVPTRYGGSSIWLGEYRSWPVHLLGGSPRAQRLLAHYLNVHSADGNMAWKLAQRGLFYDRRGIASGNSLQAVDGSRFAGHGPLEALRRSLVNIRTFWKVA